MDRFGSRRVWENSQRGCLILRHPKSYLPTHSVIHKSAIRVLAIFADASRTGYAEAKQNRVLRCIYQRWMQAARATLRQSVPFRDVINRLVDASRTGYAEAKTCCELYRAVMAADASRTGYAEAKDEFHDVPRSFSIDASRTGYAEAKAPDALELLGRHADASRTGYCARQKQTPAARQEIFDCVEKQNQRH